MLIVGCHRCALRKRTGWSQAIPEQHLKLLRGLLPYLTSTLYEAPLEYSARMTTACGGCGRTQSSVPRMGSGVRTSVSAVLASGAKTHNVCALIKACVLRRCICVAGTAATAVQQMNEQMDRENTDTLGTYQVLHMVAPGRHLCVVTLSLPRSLPLPRCLYLCTCVGMHARLSLSLSLSPFFVFSFPG